MPDEARLIAASRSPSRRRSPLRPRRSRSPDGPNFHDRPAGYKGHARPTPYLGGAAVLGGFLVAAALLGGEFARLSPDRCLHVRALGARDAR